VQVKVKNVEVFPIDESQYLKYFEGCEGILCNAGFESLQKHFLWIKNYL
jgi:hypothetical protein